MSDGGTYKCGSCGEALSGPCGYCESCAQYYHLTCAVQGGSENSWNCPNCAVQLSMATL